MMSELKLNKETTAEEAIERLKKSIFGDTTVVKCAGCGAEIRCIANLKDKKLYCGTCEQKEKDRAYRQQRLDFVLPAGYRNMTFESFRLKQGNKNLEIAFNEAKNFFSSPYGMYLYGKSGQGKTHLLISAFRNCVMAGGNAKLLRYSSEIATYTQMSAKYSTKTNIISEYSWCKYLFIDDFCSVGKSEDAADMLYWILQNRIENGLGKKIFITSNLAVNDIRDERIKSRIVGMCSDKNKKVNIIELKGKDMRLEGYI